jgi:hypothetical protein
MPAGGTPGFGINVAKNVAKVHALVCAILGRWPIYCWRRIRMVAWPVTRTTGMTVSGVRRCSMRRSTIAGVVVVLVLVVVLGTVALSRYYLTSTPQQRIYEQQKAATVVP